jgi:hypothetical protein
MQIFGFLHPYHRIMTTISYKFLPNWCQWLAALIPYPFAIYIIWDWDQKMQLPNCWQQCWQRPEFWKSCKAIRGKFLQNFILLLKFSCDSVCRRTRKWEIHYKCTSANIFLFIWFLLFTSIYFSNGMQTGIFSWLYTPRNDGKPRALRLSCSSPDSLVELIKKVNWN